MCHPISKIHPTKFTQTKICSPKNSPNKIHANKCWVNQFFLVQICFPPKFTKKQGPPQPTGLNRVSPLSHFPEDVDHTGTSNALLAKVGHEYVEDKLNKNKNNIYIQKLQWMMQLDRVYECWFIDGLILFYLICWVIVL